MLVEVEFHAVDAAIARVDNVAFPEVGPDWPGVRDQLQVALGNTTIVDGRRVCRVVKDDPCDLGAETAVARGDLDDAIVVPG